MKTYYSCYICPTDGIESEGFFIEVKEFRVLESHNCLGDPDIMLGDFTLVAHAIGTLTVRVL
jgi:hypothetical protein